MHDGTIGFTYKGGNVGIGTVSPSSKLHIQSTNEGFRLQNTINGSSQAIGMGFYSHTANTAGSITGKRNGTALTYDLIFSTTSNIDGDNIAEAMRITGAGNVGIGMTPTGLLDLQATDNLKLRFYNSTNFKAGFELATSSGDMITGSAVNDFAIRSQSNLLFASGGSTERMRLDTSGNLTVNSGSAIQFGDSSYKIIGSTAGNYLRFYTESTQALQIDDSQNATFAGDVTTSKANATGNSIILQQSLGSLASPSTSADTNILGKIQFVGKSTNDTPVGAEIKSVLTGSVGSTKNMPASLVFSTQPVGGTDLTTALTIDSSQNATFAGGVTIASGGSTDNLYLANTSYGLKITNSTGVIDFVSNGSTRMSIANGGDVTFASSIFGPSGFTLNWSSANTRIGGSHSNKNLYFDIDTGGTVFKLDANSRISLSNNDSGTSNTVFGKLAGASIDAGSNYNTFIGENVADASLNDAIYNSAVGYSTLSALTSGDYNTAIGSRALLQVNSGSQNTALGYYSGYGITTGNNNVHIGALAGEGNTGASYLVGIGDDTFRVGGVTSGANGAVAVGYQALRALTSGASNTAIGYQSAKTLTTGASNVSIGYQAMGNANLGSDKNVMIGKSAFFNGEVDEAVFIGFNAGGDGTTTTGANGTVGIGKSVLNALTSGASNTAVGYQTGNDITIGSNNTILGYQAGATGTHDITGGSNNTLIGMQSKTNSANASNQTVIGKGATGVADNSVSLGNSSVTKLYIGAGGTEQSIVFRDSADQGQIVYSHSNEQFQFKVGGDSIKARIRSGGDLYLDGGQITFPASQVASSDANTLDDYEEGDYDATVTCSTSGTITLEGAYNRLAYVKVGRSVTVTGTLIVNAVSSPSGFINISLPFAIGDGTDKSQSFSGAVHIHNANAILSRDFVNLGVEGESVLRVYVGDASSRQSDSAEGIIANTQLYIGITYQV